ncbi:MAG: hypothetical protein Q8O67_12470 [Deltaproteobacteria bacterium]|nr:hypothetical protein [Deltaproteobacteria bacterium]
MLTLIGLVLASAPACPDGDAARPVQELAAGAATVTLRVDVDGVGHLRFRLPWTNETAGPAQATASLASPGGRIAVTHARVVGGKEATLVEATDAAASWSSFVDALEHGVEEPKEGKRRFGMHVSDDDDAVAVEVAGACSVRSLVVDVDALIDPVPSAGGWRFHVPAAFAKSALRVEVPADHAVYVDGKRGKLGARDLGAEEAQEAPFVVDVGRPSLSINARGGATVLTPKGAPLIKNEDGVVEPPAEPVSTTPFTLVRAALDLPRPLSAAPPELRVVFVVDSSVSAGVNGVAMALEVVNAFLDEAPDDIGWALVTSSRTPHLLVPPWRTKSQRNLPTIAIENGSNTALAVELAEKVAADSIPGSGRVVVLSDLQLKDGDVERLPVQISAGGPRGPLVHLVQLPDDVSGERDFAIDFERMWATDDVMAYATERTGGIMINASEGGEPTSTRELGRHLVRPTRLDRPVVLLDGFEVAAGDGVVSVVRAYDNVDDDDDGTSDSLPALLVEGGGLRASFLSSSRGKNVVVVGSLWATKIELPLTSSKAGRALDVAVMANGDLEDSLDDDQVRAAAFSGHFVSRVTSLIDVPEWRPAVPEGGWGHSCCGCGGCGCGGGCSTIGRGCSLRVGNGVKLRTQEILDAIAAEAAEKCQLKKVDVDVEFGDREILQVKVEGGDACVTAYFWKQRLDERIDDTSFEAHQTRHASFEAPPEEPAEEPANN